MSHESSTTAAAALQEWNMEEVIQWVQQNMTADYHACIERIRQHDIDGKLLHQCLNDADAKTSLLRYLFPNASDAFLGLSLLRRLEKSQSAVSAQSVDDMTQTPASDIFQHHDAMVVCRHCGASLSALLIDNHQRHCAKQSQQQSPQPTAVTSSPRADNEAKQPDTSADASDVHVQALQVVNIPCAFCELPFAAHLIGEHEMYCGSRTDECGECGARDTLFRLKNQVHECATAPATAKKQAGVIYGNHGITYEETALDINNDEHQQWIPLFERHLYDLQKLLHDRFVVNYKDAAAPFAQFDAFGNRTKQVFTQKTNENVSQIRAFTHTSNGGSTSASLSNESRHKFTKTDVHDGHTKDELRKKFAEKLLKIQTLLRKILENILQQPFNAKYRCLRCSNTKLQQMLFCYSPVCEFLKLCGFVYVADAKHACYQLSHANHAKLKLAIGVLKYASDSFQAASSKHDYAQNEWELNQAYNRNDKSIFFGSWSCKRCNHLNKKSAVCKKCKFRKKHSSLKERREKEKKETDTLSVERWICGLCGNRNAVQLAHCDNCKKEKLVTQQYEKYHDNDQKISHDTKNSTDNGNDNDGGLYLDDEEWK